MIIKNQKAFTLIELMIVIAIISIIAAIALPSYLESVRKAHRRDAQAILMVNANYLERVFTESNSYASATLPYTASPKTGTSYYSISTSTLSASSYALQAVPVGGHSDTCGTLTYTSTGAKGASGSGTCW
jgi:type IV pilus assembly protein PilE